MSIDPKGLRGWRPDNRRVNDPDETEGRALYRARADSEGRLSMWRERKVTLQ